MDPVDAELTTDDQNERKIMKLLLKVENGTPRQRKTALGQLTEVFYKLDVLVRPYVHKILVVIEPLLIDENHYARVDGREIISNLSKVAGLDSMIDAMHPDIDNTDEDVRNTTARAFSVVASTLGIRALLPFLKAVCKSQTSWHARHTGIKIVYQIAILMGREVVPDLRCLVMIIEHGLNDENQKVRTITALSLAALAEAAATVGIESFESVLNPLLEGIRSHRGKVLAAFLKAIGFLIPLMDSILIKELMVPLIREFRCTDENMNKIVLKVVKECVGGLEADYIQTDILPQFYKSFWVRRMAFYPRNCKQLAETTVEIAKKVGFHEIAAIVADGLKDESEPYRIMVMVTTEKLVANLGESDIDSRLEEILTDGILFSFERQTSDDANVILNGFVTVVKSLGPRVKPYLRQVCEVINRLLKNKSAEVRQQAADLISRIAVVMKECQEEKLVRYLWGVLYGCLGEEYPEVLGSILGALKAIVNVTDMTNMNPSVKDLLKYLTPISKNKHEKVQEHCLELLGHILDRDEDVPAGLLTAISLGVVQMLIAQKKGIRHAAVNRIGYIAINAGPQEVLSALLQNLNLQDQRNRVCTAVAIAIVAETCTPVIVLSALINKYWGVPQQLNVQRWVLQSLSFLFEYISDVRKEYIDAVTPVLEDALEHRDLVHRRAAASVVKHMSLGVAGLGCEETLVHILNYVWPNIIEKSPGVIDVVMEAIEGMRVALGATVLLNYTLQGLFHPARKVREVYWKIYNLLYIGAQDALVAAYPRLEDEDDNVYSRPELTMFV